MATTSVDRVKTALIAELLRQADQSGCTTDTDGRYVQVDGSFDVELLSKAALKAVRDRP